MERSLRILAICLALALAACGCVPQQKVLTDRYYTAKAAAFDAHGWKEYVTICVSSNVIVSVEYDAHNVSGFIKSWDMDYMRIMNETDGTYPNEYVRKYSGGMVDRSIDVPAKVDVVTGATHSHTYFLLLMEACLEQARVGGSDIVYVDLPVFDEEEEAPAGSAVS